MAGIGECMPFDGDFTKLIITIERQQWRKTKFSSAAEADVRRHPPFWGYTERDSTVRIAAEAFTRRGPSICVKSFLNTLSYIQIHG